jgi:hypothetical protein
MIQQILDFLYNNWFKLALVLAVFYFIRSCGTGWIKEQIDWVKGLFLDDDDTHQDAPSHKNAILIALTIVFIIAFTKTLIYQTKPEVPDIPGGWQLVLLAGLGIAAAKTSAQKLFESKWNNGKSEPPTTNK